MGPFERDFLKGGPGSGFFGHSGRPGYRGGSSADNPGSGEIRFDPASVKSLESEAKSILEAAGHPLSTSSITGQMHFGPNDYHADVVAILENMWRRGELGRFHINSGRNYDDYRYYLPGQERGFRFTPDKP